MSEAKSRSLAGVIVCGLIALGFIGAAGLERLSSGTAREIFASGTKVQGRCTELTPTDRNNTLPRLSYRFEAEGKPHDAKYRFVLRKDWDGLKVGDAVDVWYRAGDPSACMSGPERSIVSAGPRTSIALLVIGGIFVALAALLFVLKGRRK